MHTLKCHDILRLANYCPPPDVIPRITPEVADVSNEYWTFWGIESSPYLPTGTQDGVRLRYHFGQVCMIERMNELAQLGCRVRAIVCDTLDLTEAGETRRSYGKSLATTRAVLDALLDSSIATYSMSELIHEFRSSHVDSYTAGVYDAFRAYSILKNTLAEYVFSDSTLFDLQDFRELSIPDLMYVSASLATFTDNFRAQYPVPSHILLSAAFACHHSKKSQTPFLERFWAHDGYAFWNAWPRSKPSWARPAITILEGRRSSYIWLFLECLRAISSAGSSDATDSQWPSLCFLRSVPAVNGNSYMTLDRPDGCLFLDAPLDSIRSQLLASPLSVRCEYDRRWGHLNMDPAGNDWIEAFVRKWDVLQQPMHAAGLLRNCPRKPIAATSSAEPPPRPRSILPSLCFIVASSLVLLTASALLHYTLGSHLWASVIPVVTVLLIVTVIFLTLSGRLPAQRVYDLAWQCLRWMRPW